MKYFRVAVITILFIILFIFLNKLLAPKYMETLVEGSMTEAYYSDDKYHDVILLATVKYTLTSPLLKCMKMKESQLMLEEIHSN